ncbi:hypothetical protein BURK2_00364 [Burkholderiales bacterium]|nr:MAG: DUF2249 domain-containing protein [Burkholderiales bacterium]CAG0954142.1 hypothetical protein BURK2_00364 [Burkholderiales bacterium]
MSQPHLHILPDQIYPFDARGIAKRFRHAAIFGALDALHPGETMRFVNDHDPLPLLQQLQMRYGELVEINYVERAAQGVVIDFVRR